MNEKTDLIKRLADKEYVATAATALSAPSFSDDYVITEDQKMVFDDKYSTKILLVRHGQSLGNAKNVYLGHTDLDLSPLGYAQAERTAELLRNEKIDAIYSSSLIRAYNTAMAHGRIHGLPVHGEDRLREIYIGEWENCPVSDLKTIHRDKFIGEWTENFGTSCPPGGESVPAAADRFITRLLEIARENEGKTILVGAHAAVIRASYARIKGIAPERVAKELGFPINASVSVVYFDGERLIAGEYSHASHLVGLI